MTAIPIKRVEHRFENEIMLIGTMFRWHSPASIKALQAIVGPEHFSDPMMARLYHLICTGTQEGLQGFPLTHWVMMELRGDVENLKEANLTPSKLVAMCCGQAGSLIAIEAMARQVRMDALDVDLKNAVEEYDTGSAQKIAAEMEQISKAHLNTGNDVESLGTLTARVVEELSAAYQRGAASKDYAECRLHDLAKNIGGWRRKRLYVIAGRPGMGKSTFALSALLRTAQAGHGVMMFALEMGRQELTEVALCDLAWSPHLRIEYRDIATSSVLKHGFPERFEAVHQVAPLFNSLPFYIADRGGLTVADVRAQALAYQQRLAAMNKRLEVICIDHLGLLKATSNYKGNKVAETEEVSADLKVLAKDLDCAVVALAQLSRAVEGRDDKRPNLADLRWSGGIEQDADCVMFVYRPEYYLKKEETDPTKDSQRKAKLEECRNTLEVLIEKQRGGPTGPMKFFCDIGCGVVRDLGAQHG